MATQDQIRTHYELEKELAARIMSAAPENRGRVSLEAYDELFRRITWHEGLLNTPELRARQRRSYDPFLRMVGEGSDILEIGCGNGNQMEALAPHNKRRVGIDISDCVLDRQSAMPENVELMIADASDLSAFADDSFDVAFSKQLIEHIHPDDVGRHLGEIVRVLRPGGRYILETPNRLTGPHDISAHFHQVAVGFHLKEYSYGELLRRMDQAGFRRYQSPLFRQAMYERRPRLASAAEIPADWKRPAEFLVGIMPYRWRRRTGRALRISSVFIEAWV